MTMPPECWPRCRGRSWISLEEPGEEPHATVLAVEARFAEAPLQGVVGVHVLEAPHEAREAVDLVHGDAQNLADLT